MPSLSAFDLTPSSARNLEWLLANGCGGYSSSTAIGMNSRKYHGLLVAPVRGTQDRHVLLSKLEENAEVNGQEFPLSTNLYPGAAFPQGFRHQVGFSFSTHPIFTYSLGPAKLEKSVRMPHGRNAVVISYRLLSGGDAKLSLRPLLSLRPMHSDPDVSKKEFPFSSDRFGFETKKPLAMRVCASHGKFSPLPENYFNTLYETERQRGYQFSETLFSPGVFSAELSRGEELHIACSLEALAPSDALDLLDRQAMRQRHLSNLYFRQNGIARTDFGDALALAADSFVVSSGKRHGIIAGYPWFSEWGRDTMISLDGLLLCTGRHALAREMLISYAGKMRDGLLPNLIDEGGEPRYTSSDASLWFVNAVRQYADATGDYEFIKARLWKQLRCFLSSYLQGNKLVRMDSDCLLSVSDPASTWMDAIVGGRPVVFRKGKPVEINALWHSALRFMGGLAEKFNDNRTASLCSQTAEAARASFQKFLSHEGHLFDVLSPNDASVRPNQIFAVSLPHSPLNHLQQKHVFHAVRSRLYTPLGLRTLSPSDPRYRGEYSGNQEQRDGAYHQGAIWPWLLGAFYDAQLAVYPGSERAVLSSLKPLSEAMSQGCVGTLPELYDPSSLKPAGAPSQAWSVAEILRIYTKVKKATSAAADKAAAKQEASHIKPRGILS